MFQSKMRAWGGLGFPVPLTSGAGWGRTCSQIRRRAAGRHAPSRLPVHVFGDFDLGPAGLHAGDADDGDLGVPDGQQGGIDLV
jgi:hypothetical protein